MLSSRAAEGQGHICLSKENFPGIPESEVHAQQTRTIEFADDLALVAIARDIENMQRKANESMRKINAWMEELELGIVSEKSKSGRPKEMISFRMSEHEL